MKKYKKNKAFTLIELLVVIVILAIIALIAVPQILRVLKKARLSAAEDTTYGIAQASESYIANLMMKNTGGLPSGNLVFDCDETGCYLTNESKTLLTDFQYEEKLDFKGTIPKSGTVTIENGGTKVTATDLKINEFTCQYTDEVASCEDSNGTSTPVQVSRITTYGVTATTSSINISINAKDTENGFIKACHYLYDSSDNEITHDCIENLNNINTYNETYTFNTNVEPGTEYKVKTEMYITNSEKLTSETKTVTTIAIGQPVMTISPSGSSNWAQSKTVTINYNGNSNLENYFYTSDTGTSNVGVVSCGNNASAPSTCDTTEVTSLSAGWYKTKENVEITYNTEGSKNVIARTQDNNGKFGFAEANISFIDVTPPTQPVFTATANGDSIEVTITTASTDASTVKYKYSKDNGTTWEPSEFTTSTTHTFSNLEDGDYNIVVKAINETLTNNGENSNNTVVTSATQVSIVSLPAFTTDSWSTIKTNITNNNTSRYNVGDTRCISLNGFTSTNTSNGCPSGQFLVRLANKTKSSNCSSTSYSETACGFVVEFAESITTHNMNTTDTNSGGFPASAMYTYLQGTIYNALPSDLQAAIAPTRVISGGGSGATTFTTNDVKLYLLSSVEVWGSPYYDNVTTDMTRQLDYYSNLGVTQSNYSGAIKKFGTSNQLWWLRSASSGYTYCFINVHSNGDTSNNSASITGGVALAFRIG